jgi:hypothetical protein
LQPRVRDYNGQGLVRPSLYIPFNDPSFVPKLEIEFEEHVPGFFGKAKKKAAKKQADQDMLWRRCLKAKEEGKTMGSSKKGKRAKSGGTKEKVEREGVRHAYVVASMRRECAEDRNFSSKIKK